MALQLARITRVRCLPFLAALLAALLAATAECHERQSGAEADAAPPATDAGHRRVEMLIDLGAAHATSEGSRPPSPHSVRPSWWPARNELFSVGAGLLSNWWKPLYVEVYYGDALKHVTSDGQGDGLQQNGIHALVNLTWSF